MEKTVELLRGQFETETGEKWWVAPVSHAETGYASWEYQLWLEKRASQFTPSATPLLEATPPTELLDVNKLRNCYNEYISLLAEQLFQFRKLAKEIHSWAIETSLEKKIKALYRLESEFYQLSITPESNEIINARKKLADAIVATSPAPLPIQTGDVDWFEFVMYLTGYKKEQVERQMANWKRNIKQ